MTESESTMKVYTSERKRIKEKELYNSLLFGALPNAEETQKAMSNATEKVITSLADISCNTEKVTEDFVRTTIKKFQNLAGREETDNAYLVEKEILSPKQMQSVLQETRDEKITKKVNNLRNLNLSNEDWKNLMHIAGSGDTMDSKNILLVWNAIRKTSWEIRINIQDPKGTHNTCNYVEHTA